MRPQTELGRYCNVWFQGRTIGTGYSKLMISLNFLKLLVPRAGRVSEFIYKVKKPKFERDKSQKNTR